MYITDGKGKYIKNYIVTNNDIFSLTGASIKVIRTTDFAEAKEFPDTAGIFDLLELLNKAYPNNEWKAEVSNGEKCFNIIDRYWCQLERLGLIDSCSGHAEKDRAEICATYTDDDGNTLHIEIAMWEDDLKENQEEW